MARKDDIRDWEEELSIFFEDAELSNEVEFHSGLLAGETRRGIFDVRFSDQDLGSMRVATENSQFLGSKQGLSKVNVGDLLRLSDGTSYKVVAIHTDKVGQVLLDLSEEILR